MTMILIMVVLLTPGKFYKALFSIMKTCGDEFKSYDVKETKSKMVDYLNKLTKALKKLSKKQDYARILLGKIATIFTKVLFQKGPRRVGSFSTWSPGFCHLLIPPVSKCEQCLPEQFDICRKVLFTLLDP